jgi:hypothetical protein
VKLAFAPGEWGRAASCAGGLLEIVLRAYTARTLDASRPGYPGPPLRRIAGGSTASLVSLPLDR